MSMVYVGVAISAISLAVTTTASYQQSENAKDIADYNAKVEDMKAKDAANIGANEAADMRAKARKLISAQVEAGGLSGVDLDYGSPLGLLVETAGIGEKEALTVMNNAQRQSWGHTQQSKLDQLKSDQERRAQVLNTAGTALSGASGFVTAAKPLWK